MWCKTFLLLMFNVYKDVPLYLFGSSGMSVMFKSRVCFCSGFPGRNFCFSLSVLPSLGIFSSGTPMPVLPLALPTRVLLRWV